MKKNYPVSVAQGRRQMAHKERLKASMVKTHGAAQRWFDATQARGERGGGEAGLAHVGQVVQNVRTTPQGQRNLVRWHDGLMSFVWFPGKSIEVGSFVVVKTAWNLVDREIWLEDRPLRVVQLIDEITKKDLEDYETYWRCSRELDEIEMKDLMMIAPVDPTEKAISSQSVAPEVPSEQQVGQYDAKE